MNTRRRHQDLPHPHQPKTSSTPPTVPLLKIPWMPRFSIPGIRSTLFLWAFRLHLIFAAKSTFVHVRYLFWCGWYNDSILFLLWSLAQTLTVWRLLSELDKLSAQYDRQQEEHEEVIGEAEQWEREMEEIRNGRLGYEGGAFDMRDLESETSESDEWDTEDSDFTCVGGDTEDFDLMSDASSWEDVEDLWDAWSSGSWVECDISDEEEWWDVGLLK